MLVFMASVSTRTLFTHASQRLCELLGTNICNMVMDYMGGCTEACSFNGLNTLNLSSMSKKLMSETTVSVHCNNNPQKVSGSCGHIAASTFECATTHVLGGESIQNFSSDAQALHFSTCTESLQKFKARNDTGKASEDGHLKTRMRMMRECTDPVSERVNLGTVVLDDDHDEERGSIIQIDFEDFEHRASKPPSSVPEPQSSEPELTSSEQEPQSSESEPASSESQSELMWDDMSMMKNPTIPCCGKSKSRATVVEVRGHRYVIGDFSFLSSLDKIFTFFFSISAQTVITFFFHFICFVAQVS